MQVSQMMPFLLRIDGMAVIIEKFKVQIVR